MQKKLWELLSPQTITDIIGQKHLINEQNGLIYKMINQKYLLSLILWGPSGVGKSSLVKVIVKYFSLPHYFFNAAIDKKKILDNILSAAENKQIILVIEEIHRMNRDKQEILLEYLQANKIILFACTTENPFFNIVPPLRSRCTILKLEKLTTDEIKEGLKKAFTLPDYNKEKKFYSDEILNEIALIANGDFRIALRNLEILLTLYPQQTIGENILKNVFLNSNIEGYKEGDTHHDLKSALQKSIRGSDVNAALYYFSQLLLSGDVEALLRRMLIIAYEDIGLANPNVPVHVKTAIDSFRELGMPEGRIPLGLVIIEMALSQKSNSALIATDLAIADIEKGKIYSIPNYLKSMPYPNNKEGTKYLYPHNFPNHYVNQQYLPSELKKIEYYQANLTNVYEKKINELFNNMKQKK